MRRWGVLFLALVLLGVPLPPPRGGEPGGGPSHPLAGWFRAEAAWAAGDRAGARAGWAELGGDLARFLEVARVHLSRRQPEEARRWIYRAMALDPQAGDPWFWLGQIAERERDWVRARWAYQEGLKRPFRQVGGSDLRARLAWLWQFKRGGPQDLERALQLYDEALALNRFRSARDRATALYNRATIYRWQKRFDAAVADLEEAARLWPENRWIWYFLGYNRFLAGDGLAAAVGPIRRGIDLAPQDPSGYWFLAEVYRLAGEAERAREFYRKVLELKPDHEGAKKRLKELEGKQP